jgi:hypothetical protein
MATTSYPIQVDTGAAKVLEQQTTGIHPTPHRQRARKSGEVPVERRANQRFELPLEFDLFHLRGAKRLAWHSSGITVDWSRNSVLLQCGRKLAVGGSAQLVVRWVAGVQLIVVGRVIRCDERGMVFKIQRRRFRGKPLLIVSLSQLINWQPAGRPN